MSTINFYDVWEKIDSTLEQELISFWLDNKALPSRENALLRVPQVAVIARDADGQLVGVSTAYEQYNTQLESHFYYVRAFVVESARRSSVALDLLKHVKSLFEARYAAGNSPRCIGLYMEVENKLLQKHRNEAVWPRTQFVYIGKNAKGDHMRVYYFDGVKIC